MLLDSSHLSMLLYPSILAPEYNTSIDLDILSKLSFLGGSKVSGFSKAFSKPFSFFLILNT